MPTCNEPHTIHSRIRLTDGSVGTIRYIGEVTGHKGNWLGVEWDDASRGKHNGTVNGISYFNTSHATSGSLVRPEKTMPCTTVRSEIENKYILSDNIETDAVLLAETQKMLHASIFEVVGMDKIKQKQSKLSDFDVISLDACNATAAGQLSGLTNLSTLDLTASLISSWTILADVCQQIPTLSHLNISETRLHLPNIDEIPKLSQHFGNLRALNMRSCALSDWTNVLLIARLWPNIESLALQGNDIAKLTEPDNNVVFQRLLQLDLQQNKLSDFQQVLALGHVVTLQNLYLMDNSMERLHFPDKVQPNERIALFPNLIELNVKGNSFVDECDTFNELDKLPALTSLFYSVNPATGYETMFSNCVSRISALTRINGTPVTNACRRGAEYDLWKALGTQWTNATTEEERTAIALRCRAYPRLVKKYGSPAGVCMAAAKVSNLITIEIRLASTANELATPPPIVKRVSRKMSVQALLGVVMKAFANSGLASTTMPTLGYVSSSRKEVTVPMDNLSKSLDYYSMQDGDTVVVEWSKL